MYLYIVVYIFVTYLCHNSDKVMCLILLYNVLLCVFHLIKSNLFRLNCLRMQEITSTFDSKDETWIKGLIPQHTERL